LECVNHPGVEPAARCVECGAYLCEECIVDRDRIYCSSCDPDRTPTTRPSEEQGRSEEEASPPPEACQEGLEETEPGPELQVDIGRSFSFMLDDPDWIKKLALGGLFVLLSFLIVPIFFIAGYMVEVMRNTAAGEDATLPEWKDFWPRTKLGAGFVLLKLIYCIPLFITVGLTSVVGIYSAGGQGNLTLDRFLLALFFIGWFVVLGVALLIRLVTPAFAGLYAVTGEVRKSLHLGVIIGMVQSDIRSFLMVLAVAIFATWLAIAVGFVACCIGVFFTVFYAFLVNSHLYGQLARVCPED